MTGKKEYTIFQEEGFQTLSTIIIQFIQLYLFKLLDFHRKKIFVSRCRAIMLYKMINNNSVSTGLILLTPTVYNDTMCVLGKENYWIKTHNA